MENQVIYSDYVKEKLDMMTFIMFEKGYFHSLESSEKYISRIYDFIDTIYTQPQKTSVSSKYGKYYAKYKNAKSEMHYYITFDTLDGIYYIEDIISPKTKEYLEIVDSIKKYKTKKLQNKFGAFLNIICSKLHFFLFDTSTFSFGITQIKQACSTNFTSTN